MDALKPLLPIAALLGLLIALAAHYGLLASSNDCQFAWIMGIGVILAGVWQLCEARQMNQNTESDGAKALINNMAEPAPLLAKSKIVLEKSEARH